MIILLAFIFIIISSPVSAQCCADCNGDGKVSIAEIVAAVNIALGREPCSASTAIPTPASSLVGAGLTGTKLE